MRRVCYGAGALRWAMRGALAPFFLWVSIAYTQGPELQTGSPGVHWQIDLDPPRVPNGWEAEVVFRADIAPGCILYSSDFKSNLGPKATRFSFDPTAAVVLLGALHPIEARRRKDRTFHMEYTYFQGRAEFRQRLRINARPATISGRIEGQVCREADGTCTLIRKEFSLLIE
jgi:hypothetical protein